MEDRLLTRCVNVICACLLDGSLDIVHQADRVHLPEECLQLLFDGVSAAAIDAEIEGQPARHQAATDVLNSFFKVDDLSSLDLQHGGCWKTMPKAGHFPRLPRQCRNLSRLCLSRCFSFVFDGLLQQLSNCCPNLTMLDMSLCDSLENPVFDFPKLLHLDVSHCRSLMLPDRTVRPSFFN